MLPDSKTGRKAVRLSPPSLAVLHDIPRLEGNPYVICGEKAGRHLVNIEQPWRRIRKAARLDDVRLHDLRHSFASVAASGGQSLIVIGKMLGHSEPAMTARYAHLADDPVKAASDAVGSISRQRWMAALKYLGQTCLKERETERGRQVHSQEDLICGKNAKKVCQQSTFRSVLNKIDFNINERGVEQVWRKRISKQGLRID